MKTHIFEFLIIQPDGVKIPSDAAHDRISVTITTEENEKMPELIEKVISLELKEAFMDYSPQKIKEDKELLNEKIDKKIREIFDLDFDDICILTMDLSHTLRLNGQAYGVKIVPKRRKNRKNVLSNILSLLNIS